MEYQEFKNALISAVEERVRKIDPQVQVVEQQAEKNNSVSMEALSVRGSSNLSPMVYPEKLYEDYKGGNSIEEIASFVAGSFEAGPSERFGPDQLKDWEEIKDRVVLQVVAKENNQGLMQNIPCREAEDMLLTYRVLIDVTDDGTASMQVTNMLQQMYGVTEETLYQTAMKNSPELLPVEFKSMSTVMMEFGGEEFVNPVSLEEMLREENEGQGMYILTNTFRANGASAIFYPEVMDKIAAAFDQDMIVLPSSIHECIVLPRDIQMDLDIEEYKAMVTEINETQVLPEERLTNQVYVWDKEAKQLMIADNWQAQKLEKDSREKRSLKDRLKEKKAEVGKTATLPDGKDDKKRAAEKER